MTVAKRLVAGIGLFVFSVSCLAIPGQWSEERKHYESALEAIEKRQWSQFDRLRPALDQYPLAVYLDYQRLTSELDTITPAQATAFIDSSRDTPLANRFLSLYLHNAGKRRAWSDFLAVMPDEPSAVVLKCYYHRAQLAQGNRDTAWAGARQLWVHGKSQPKACDPLFTQWMKDGGLDDATVWTRMLNAFDARQGKLMRYVARKASPALSDWSRKLLAVYAQPRSLRAQVLPPESPYSADIATHGLAYLARYNPEQALAHWQRYQQELTFTDEQSQYVEREIALRGLFARTASMDSWLRGALVRLGDDKLVEIRLRWALAEQDWTAVEATLPLLSEAARGDSNWRYWAAIVHEREGRAAESRALLAQLATERGYYSFRAADKLGLSYAFNHQTLASPGDLLAALPEHAQAVVQRIAELHYHEEENLAHSEWFTMLRGTADPAQKQQLAMLAADQGWYRMAIDAANRAKAWDALDLRFPQPYQSTFAQYADESKVPTTELMAIARRESAFFPQARSPVGARGLMQIMPATGKQVASSIGKRHRNSDLYEIEHNVHLGSTYYRQLLDRFGGNRIFALAAYNAGPHRVDRWRNGDGDAVPVDIWVETIPFRETRNYVQAVLAYNVVFGYLMGDTYTLLTPLEKQAVY